MNRLVRSEYDAETGITEEFWYEETPGDQKNKIHIRRLQDVEHTLGMNKVLFNAHQGKKPKYNDTDGLHHVARIPMVIVEQWMREGFDWFNSSDKQRRTKLNDSDFSKLLVRPGKL